MIYVRVVKRKKYIMNLHIYIIYNYKKKVAHFNMHIILPLIAIRTMTCTLRTYKEYTRMWGELLHLLHLHMFRSNSLINNGI